MDEEQALSESIQPIAKDALIILINISNDSDVLGLLAEDDAFLETLLVRITVCQLSYHCSLLRIHLPFHPSTILDSPDRDPFQNPKEPNADAISMLLANLSKSPSITRIVTLTRTTVPALSSSKLAVTQLLELFNKGAERGYNAKASFDYLAWLFGDLAKVL